MELTASVGYSNVIAALLSSMLLLLLVLLLRHRHRSIAQSRAFGARSLCNSLVFAARADSAEGPDRCRGTSGILKFRPCKQYLLLTYY